MLIAKSTPPRRTPIFDRIAAKMGTVGTSLDVRRMLPHAKRRQIGPWTFLDHFGPADLAATEFDVAPHPHTGLSTVTWVVEGEILHKDSLDSEQIIRPGQLNWMTAGKGISHSEEVPKGATGNIHGVQLWLAMPDAHRHSEPSFQHFAELPRWRSPGAVGTVLAGSANGLTSPARTHSPLVGMDIERFERGTSTVPLNPAFEHGVILAHGSVRIDGQVLNVGEMAYLGMARSSVDVQTQGPAKVVIVGGEPLGEDILLWWNFIGRTHDEMVQFRSEWEAADPRFGRVDRYESGRRLAAPPIP